MIFPRSLVKWPDSYKHQWGRWASVMLKTCLPYFIILSLCFSSGRKFVLGPVFRSSDLQLRPTQIQSKVPEYKNTFEWTAGMYLHWMNWCSHSYLPVMMLRNLQVSFRFTIVILPSAVVYWHAEARTPYLTKLSDWGKTHTNTQFTG